MLLLDQLRFKVLAVFLVLALVIPIVMMPVGTAQAQEKNLPVDELYLDDYTVDAISNNKIQNVIQDNSSDVEAQIWPVIIKQMIKFIVKRVGSKVQKQIWPKLEKEVDNVVEKYHDLSVRGPGGGERVFALISKKSGEIFRLDAKLLKKHDGYYFYVHYHKKPNMNTHHPIGDHIYIGKNRPSGFRL